MRSACPDHYTGPEVRDGMTGWQSHFLYRKEVWKTTWKLRLSVVLFFVVAVILTRSFLTDRIGQSLVCEERADPSDALLMENFDPDYLVFERTAALKSAGVASRVVVPVWSSSDPTQTNASSLGVVSEFARIARLSDITPVPTVETEPIALNVAKTIRDYLVKEHIRSVVVVTPGFRSRRSVLIYNAVFAPVGIKFGCVPVFGKQTPQNWSQTWHGIQDIFLQIGKLEYYRFYVLS